MSGDRESNEFWALVLIAVALAIVLIVLAYLVPH